jgi:hypothetical protein
VIVQERSCRTASLVILLVGLTPAAWANFPPPGSKLVQHDAVFENVNDYPDHIFFVEPLLRRLPETGVVTVGRDPLYQLRHGGLFLFALPKSQFKGDQFLTPDDDWFAHPPEGALMARVPLPQIEAAPLSDPRNRFE